MVAEATAGDAEKTKSAVRALMLCNLCRNFGTRIRMGTELEICEQRPQSQARVRRACCTRSPRTPHVLTVCSHRDAAVRHRPRGDGDGARQPRVDGRGALLCRRPAPRRGKC